MRSRSPSPLDHRPAAIDVVVDGGRRSGEMCGWTVGAGRVSREGGELWGKQEAARWEEQVAREVDEIGRASCRERVS